MITFPRSALRAAVHCAATKTVRSYLMGVHIECAASGDVHIVSTDGHVLFAGKICAPNVVWTGEPQKGPWRMTLPLDVVKRECKGKGSVDLVSVSDSYRLGDTMFKPIDGVYPDWRRVIGVGDVSLSPLNVNVDLLMSAHKAVGEWQGNTDPCSTFTEHRMGVGISTSGGVVRVVGTTAQAFAIVMPLRTKREDVGPRDMFVPSSYAG